MNPIFKTSYVKIVAFSLQLREKFRKAIFWVKIALKFSSSASGR